MLNDPAGASLVANQLYSVNFIIHPPSWPEADILPRFAWRSVKFSHDEKKNVPNEPGLYAFVTRLPYDGLPSNAWVMYIGQAGDGGSSNTLRKRFGAYLNNKKQNRRQRVYWLLNVWDGHLEFFFTALPDRKAELESLETKLLGAFRPPFTDRTYPVTAMSPAHAF